MPKVTVVIPAFNAQRYIRDALESVRHQTFQDLEVIVVDDGSTDSTVHEAQRFARAFDLTILQQRNSGPSAARNAGIRRAHGRYCALLDADDLMLPELLATQSAVLDADAELGMVVADIITFDDSGIIKNGHWMYLPGTRQLLDSLLIDNFVTTSAVMAPTERLIDAGLFPEHRRVAEDYELWLNIAARWKVALIDRPMVCYRYATGSLSYDKLYSALCALNMIETFWKGHPSIRYTRPHIYRRSMARHHCNAGATALAEGRRLTALGYLLNAVRYQPAALQAWKQLAKTLLPYRRIRQRERPKPNSPTEVS